MKKQYVIVALGLSLGLFFTNISVSKDFARTSKRDADHHWPTSRLLLSILLFVVVAIPTQ
ncbi:hypothetical protein LBR02_21030 [Levilactobacillus brevis]|nr:hypothetical protein LBR02_21030 [Levilactobacillus brevis]